MCVQGTAPRHCMSPRVVQEGDWDRHRWNNVAAPYEAPTRVELDLAYSVHTTWVFVSSLSLVLY